VIVGATGAAIHVVRRFGRKDVLVHEGDHHLAQLQRPFRRAQVQAGRIDRVEVVGVLGQLRGHGADSFSGDAGTVGEGVATVDDAGADDAVVDRLA